jgi:hypothetical protein
MYIRLIVKEEDISKTLKFLLYICRIKVLEETMACVTGFESSSILKKCLIKTEELIVEYKLQSIRSEKWDELIEESNLYSAYLDKDVDKVYKCIQLFKHRKKLTTEFHAVNIWLQILPQLSGIQAKYQHRERLRYLLWMCELVFSLINNIDTKEENQIKKDFEDIFCILEVNNSKERQIPYSNPLLYFVSEVHESRIKDAEETTNDRHCYNVNDIYRRILQCLNQRIFELIKNADQKGREIPDISSHICHMFTSCQEPDCQNHHVIPTPSILYRRLEFVCLQYTVMMKFDVNVLEDHRFLQNEQIKQIIKVTRNLQKWWSERLVKTHIRYKSPQISCPEATYIFLAKFPAYARDRFSEFARKTWLADFKYINNFEVILKYMFVFQRLQNKQNINKINWEMTRTRNLSRSSLPIGFEYYKGHNKAIPVGNRLSSFFFYLYFNDVINAISNVEIFIQYAISNAQSVNLITSDSLGDLVSLMEFTTSLIFATKSEYCNFCIPRAYLINYFEAFTTEPLIPNYQHNRNKVNYPVMIKNSFEHVQQLLNSLICEEMVHLSIILRLIRLLILISMNEPKFATRVIIFFKYLNRRVFSAKIKKYLENKSMEQLINVLYNDLKETNFDSLVIVHYNVENSRILSKFSNLEKNGVMKLKYKSLKEVHSALQRIKSSIDIREKVTNVNKLQIWFCRIRDLSRSQNAIRKLQVWIRRVFKRIKSRKPNYDPLPDKIYNNMTNFCKVIAKDKNKKSVRKYIILLKGQTVDVVVKLLRLYRRTKSFINNCSPDKNNINRYDELRFVNIWNLYCSLSLTKFSKICNFRDYHNKVEQALKSLSITKNSVKHKEIDIKWLENELQEARAKNSVKHKEIDIKWLENELQEARVIINKLQKWMNNKFEFRRLEATIKIQVWIRRVYKRIKSRKPGYDPMPDRIYNDMTNFCKVIAKDINKKSVRKYIILLRGQTVDVVVELLRLYRRTKTFISNSSPDKDKSNQCLELRFVNIWNFYITFFL